MSLLSAATAASDTAADGPKLRRSVRSEAAAATADSGKAAAGLLKTVDVLLALLVFGLPFIMGGREAWGHRWLITISLALAASWSLYAAVAGRRLALTGFELWFAAGLALVWFQTQPQTPEKLQQFSTEYDRLLPAWQLTQTSPPSAAARMTAAESVQAAAAAASQGEPGPAAGWSTLSLVPHETRHAWWMLLSYLIVAVVTCQRLQTLQDCERLLKWVGLSAVAMTGFAIAQLATSNGRFFWFYRNPFTGTDDLLKGAFTNRNHFAQFLALSIGPLLWWLTRTLQPASEPALPSRRRNRKRKSREASRSFQTTENSLGLPFLGLLSAVSVVGFCVLMSLSRGGMIAAAAAFLVAMAGLWSSLKLKSGISLVLMSAAALVLGLLVVVGQDQIQSRVDQLVSGDADTVDPGNARRAIWAADLTAFQAFPVFGTGVGSHAEVYPTYMEDFAEFANTQFSHAESSYINVLLETGAVGAGLLVSGLLLLLLRLLAGFIRRDQAGQKAMIAVVTAAAMAGILHAVADFIWYVPAIVVVSIVLAIVGIRASQQDLSAGGLPLPRIAWLCLAVVCCLAAFRVQPTLAARVEGQRHWYAYLTQVFDEQSLAAARKYAYRKDQQDKRENLFADILQPHPEQQAEPAAAAKIQQVSFAPDSNTAAITDQQPTAADEPPGQQERLQATQEKIRLLQAVVTATPQHVPARLALAQRLLELFQLLQSQSDNPLSLNQVRDAATASGFESPEEQQEWLRRAFGRNIALPELAGRLARQALSDCPLPREAWLTLIETNFLQDPGNASHQALVSQALLLRPHDPAARFVIGREALVAGDVPTAIEHWQMVFHSSPQHRLGILRLLAPQVPAEFFINLFEPNAEELQDMLAVYDALQQPQESAAVLQQLTRVIPAEAALLEDDEERLQLQLLAYAAAVRLEDYQFAETHLRSLIQEFPVAYKPRHYLGLVLFQQQRFDEALPVFEWCHDRDPGNSWLPRLIVRCRKATLRESVNDQDDPLRRFRSY